MNAPDISEGVLGSTAVISNYRTALMFVLTLADAGRTINSCLMLQLSYPHKEDTKSQFWLREIITLADGSCEKELLMSTQPWGFIWRSAGIQSVVLFVIAYFLYGDLPKVGSSPDTLVSFYDGNRMRILIATFILGFAILNLLWFAAAIREVLRDAGQDGWGAAVTASSAVVGGVFFVLISVGAALAYKIAGSGNQTFASGLSDVAWVCFVFSSFPRAMLIMAPTFGLWRAGIMSNTLFAVGVAAVVLGLLGGTTWAADGIWAPDGAYSRLILPIISLAWIVVISAVLSKSASAARTPDQQW